MKTSKFAIISVFTNNEFNCQGNTAAILELDHAISEQKMQQIAADLNQPASTFIWQEENKWHIRWFAPDGEIGLCGHGSLAALAYLNKSDNIPLYYKGGVVSGRSLAQGRCCMSISPIISKESAFDSRIEKGLGVSILGYFKNDNKDIVLVESEMVVRNMKPDFSSLKDCEPFGYIVTAQGEQVDFVSRTIVPKVKQLEDAATGSSHAALTPFWSNKLNKQSLSALQLSSRGGKFDCEMKDDHVLLTGSYEVLALGQYNLP